MVMKLGLSHLEKKNTDEIWEQGAEENIWT
jgi:hypothetical protein